MKELQDMSRKELIQLLKDAAKNWLAHDGLWFQAVENKFNMKTAIELDRNAWIKFTVVEAKRIMKRLDIQPGGGLKALEQALTFRLYARINEQEFISKGPNRAVFRMNKCRVQDARKRKGLPDFPCKSVGIEEYRGFARTIDPRIKTRCIACPPDPHPDEYWCAWEFTIA
jgi:hypothetical protein